jgi:serine/threonine protein kinase
MTRAQLSAAEAGQDPAGDVELAQVLEGVLADVEAGRPVDVERLLADHPAVADDLRACLASLRFIEKGAGSLACPEASGAAAVENLGDFRIHREIGRGGMGIVYEAEQLSLGRKVALKVLPFAAALDPRQLQRFKHEAHAAAHLHHQNIVPVYFVGADRGVHFYAMQYIEGQTLAALIRQLRQLAGKPDPEGDAGAAPASDLARQQVGAGHMPVPAELRLGDSTTDYGPNWQAAPTPSEIPTPGHTPGSTQTATTHPTHFRTVAKLGIQAATALEHAHQLGIIHRDIKPGNLLVDGCGKLWITDFGLAHIQGDAQLTLTGDLVGTLRYMSPEQALGKRALVDHRTDIYSLGVTLYELLTLEPAFGGNDRQEVLRRIAFEDARPLRRLNKVIPAELETIVLKALEKNPIERYASAQEMADDLERFLKDEPIRARRPSLLQAARKWARRHRGVSLTTAVAVILGLVLGVAGLLVHNQRLLWEQAQTTVALDEKATALAQEAARRQALRQALDDLTSPLIDEWLARQKVLLPEHKQFLDTALAHYEKFADDIGQDEATRAAVAKAYGRVARIRAHLGHKGEAEKAYRRALTAFTQLAADFPSVPEYRYDLAATHRYLGIVLQPGAMAQEELTRALRIAEQLVKDFPATDSYRHQLAITHNALGGLLWDQGHAPESLVELRKALTMEQQLAKEFPSCLEYRQQLAIYFNNLGRLLAELGEVMQAEAEYRKALAIRLKLAGEFPGVPDYSRDAGHTHNTLGYLLSRLARLAEAEDEYHKALTIRTQLAGAFPAVPEYRHQLAGTHGQLGNLLIGLARARQAKDHYQQALAIQRQLAADFPTVPEYQRDLAAMRCAFGNGLKNLGQRAEAEAEFAKALAIQKKMVKDFASVPQNRLNLAMTQCDLARLLQTLGRATEAEHHYQNALANLAQLVRDFPKTPEYRRMLATSHHDMGRELSDLRRAPEAEEEFRKAVTILKQLVQVFPTAPSYRIQLSRTYNELGLLFLEVRDLAEARTAHESSLAIREKLLKDFPAVAEYAVELGGSYCNLGHVVRDQGQAAAALEWYGKAVATLGSVLKQKRRPATAAMFLRNAHLGRAMTFDQLNRPAEAGQDWERAIQLDDGSAHAFLRARLALSLVRVNGQQGKAVAEANALAEAPGAKAGTLYNAACVYARAAAASQDAGLTEKYAARAVDLLRRAVAGGYRDVTHMRNDHDLDALRAHADFKELLRQLDKDR